MLVIGLIGGIASGKSFVAECFRELGAKVLHADQIGHSVLENFRIARAIKAHWPTAVDADGRVVRERLAEIVFRSPHHRKELEKLEKLTHPLIGREINRKLSEFRLAGYVAAILDAPVLLEAGWQSKCSKIVFVDTPVRVRRERAGLRGWKADELEKREQAQMSLEEKRAAATDRIHNTNKEETRSAVRQLWSSWGMPFPSLS